MNSVIDAIKKRHSCRNYDSGKKIKEDDIITIIETVRWTPSGKNYQPWGFYINTNKSDIEKIASYSIYSHFIKQAPCIISVYLNKNESYSYLKDSQAIGAAIQNILLTAFSLGIASCWIGEILKNKDEIARIHNVGSEFELMGIVILGYEGKISTIYKQSTRKSIDEILIDWKKDT